MALKAASTGPPAKDIPSLSTPSILSTTDAVVVMVLPLLITNLTNLYLSSSLSIFCVKIASISLSNICFF